MTPLLQEMHWLPIKFRPQYKIATFVHRFFDGSLPGYLSQTLCAYEPTRKRSSCEKLLKVSKRNIKTFGELSFSFLALVWNSLPSDLRNSSTLPLFKSRLKTHLFTTAFCQVGSLQSSAPASPPPPTSYLPPTPTLTPRMNVLPEYFSCFTVRVRERERECRERQRWWMGREYACM